MDLIKLKNITKQFPLGDKEYFVALKNINLSLPTKGFISILGKSGCGKSTLLNILSKLDKPTKGEISYLGNNKSINVGMIFQHYYLFEDEDVIFNIVLPALIKGQKERVANKLALELLKSINFPKNLYHKKVKDLSGGEKQRVAILRSLINEPDVIFADEPTGALDSKNSISVIEILKNVSRNKLVVMVSHNSSLVNKYSDRIITMKDGQIVSDDNKNKDRTDDYRNITNVHYKYGRKWIEKISKKNVRRRFKRNIFSISALTISLLATTLVIGFSTNASNVVNKESKKRIDYGVLDVSIEEKNKIDGSLLSLVQQRRPSAKDIGYLSSRYPSLIFEYNYEQLFSFGAKVFLNDEDINNISLRPIYDFSYLHNNDLLLEGSWPTEEDSFEHVLINKKALDLFKSTLKINPIDLTICIKNEYENDYYTYDEANEIVKDFLVIEQNMTICGVVDELSFLSTPTIYYSYLGLKNYLDDILLNNLSRYIEEDIYWTDRVERADDAEEISGYSIKAFLKNDVELSQVKSIIADINTNGFAANSVGLAVEESLASLVSASTSGLWVFLIISMIGVVMIIGILSLFSYTEDIKKCAILSALGAKRNDIIKVYLLENILIGFLSLMICFIFIFPLIYLGNVVINQYIGISSFLVFPQNVLTRFKYDYAFIVFFMMLFTVFISTYFPINFSKKISVAKELKDE